MVIQLRRQVEGVTSHWGQRRGGFINFKIMGSFKGALLTGRPRCSTREENEAVRRVHEENPFRSANQIRPAANFPGISRTVMNRLKEANIISRRAASKEDLTEGQAVDHLAFATGWRDFDWGSVIFTDETSISSDCESSGHVYREPGTRYDTRYIQRRERSGRFRVSCWGWMSRDGVGVLERIHGRFNAPRYLHILENVMLPSVRVWNPEGNLIFQQDNLPVHCNMGVQRWFARKPEIELIPWPTKTSDLNVIEHCGLNWKNGES